MTEDNVERITLKERIERHWRAHPKDYDVPRTKGITVRPRLQPKPISETTMGLLLESIADNDVPKVAGWTNRYLRAMAARFQDAFYLADISVPEMKGGGQGKLGRAIWLCENYDTYIAALESEEE